MTTYYKILAKGHRACHGGTYRYTPNRWTERIENPVECKSGYHIVTADNLTKWLYVNNDQLPLELWEVEAEGVRDSSDKSVAERIKLTRLVGTLDEYDLRWLATEFAITALPHTDDTRVAECINTVRAYCLGLADTTDLVAAESAAQIAESAAWSAAWSAARSAESAARSAWSAAWSAAASAAWSAAASAAESAAESAAWRTCGQIVLDYLGDE